MREEREGMRPRGLEVGWVARLCRIASATASGSSTPCPWYSDVESLAPGIWVIWLCRVTGGIVEPAFRATNLSTGQIEPSLYRTDVPEPW